MAEPAKRAVMGRVVLGFACIYLVWGGTFLAIRVALETIPPLLLCGARLLVAGVMLLAWAKLAGTPWPRGAQWRNAAVVGLLLPAAGNGLVTLGETHVPSGIVALLMSTIPLWMALLASFGPQASPPGKQALAGLVMGFAGVALLIGPGLLPNATHEFSPLWAILPMIGALSWAYGSLWSRRVPMPRSPLSATAVGMTVGGVALLVMSVAAGEFAHFEPARVTPGAIVAMVFLIVFGSVIAFSAYLYLLGRVRPEIVATYAFVNPVVAMALGWAFAGEHLSTRTLAAAAIVIVAVALITTARARIAAVVPPRPAGTAGAAMNLKD
ncbi:MAG: EamA family transporter [Candidatus Eisenbacteria bacterium]